MNCIAWREAYPDLLHYYRMIFSLFPVVLIVDILVPALTRTICLGLQNLCTLYIVYHWAWISQDLFATCDVICFLLLLLSRVPLFAVHVFVTHSIFYATCSQIGLWRCHSHHVVDYVFYLCFSLMGSLILSASFQWLNAIMTSMLAFELQGSLRVSYAKTLHTTLLEVCVSRIT